MTGYAPAYTKSVEKGSVLTYDVVDIFCKKGIFFAAKSHFKGTRMSRALRCLGLKMGSENIAL